MLKRRPKHERERGHGRLRAAAKADDFETRLGVILKRTGHLVQEVKTSAGK